MSGPYYEDDLVTLWHGDCLDVLQGLPDASVDAVVTDPPYGLEFMGKDWDSFKGDAWRNSAGITRTGYTDGGNRVARPSYGGGDSANPTCATCGGRKRGAKKCSCAVPEWRVKGKPLDQRDNNAAQMRSFQEWCGLWAAECFRVLKPGGHMLAFGGSRTWHRLAAGIEDAGFEIRDSVAWLYGSGFPKSLDVSKAIDAHLGGDREPDTLADRDGVMTNTAYGKGLGVGIVSRGKPGTSEAAVWEGWGTALKPSFEPVVVARKPLISTVAANVLAHGTGALNIDGCRVGDGSDSEGERPEHESSATARYAERGAVPFTMTPGPRGGSPSGRWPTNVVLDESQAEALDRQSGVRTSGMMHAGQPRKGKPADILGAFEPDEVRNDTYGDSGGASRFFPTFRYEAKAPTSERPKVGEVQHPTVKPLDLMRWLVRLVTPPNGVVLEPFAGSGTTLEAAVLEGFRCIGIEREADYLPLIEQRLSKPMQQSLFDDLMGGDAA